MKKKFIEAHDRLQKSIDNMQKQNDEITAIFISYAGKLGKAIGYEHKEKSIYRILVRADDKDYDMYDLLEQTLEHLKK